MIKAPNSSMSDGIKLAAASLVVFCCLSCSKPQPTAGLSGKVISIADGDTLTILGKEGKHLPIRLAAIDAPENGQPLGDESKDHLIALAMGKDVAVELNGADRYGRIVGRALLNEQDLGLEQVKAGFAWFYRRYESELGERDRTAYAVAEIEARVKRIGLWSDPSPIPPWDYRHPETALGDGRPSRDSSTESGSPTQSGSAANSGNANNSGDLKDPKAIIGNRRSRIYHWPGCPNYDDVAPQNREYFRTKEDAEKAGYRAARNCPD